MNEEELSKPILISPKNNTNISNYSLNNDFDNTYVFILNLKLKNNKIDKIIRYEISKVSNSIASILLTNKNKILFNDILSYNITININETSYTLEGNINEDSTYSINNSGNVFIEFSQDDIGYVNCICYLINKDINLLCITPP